MQINHLINKLQSLVGNVVKCGKYSLAKFANFVYFCISCGNCNYHFQPKYKNVVAISAHNTKVYKICELCKADFPHFTTFLNQTLQFY